MEKINLVPETEIAFDTYEEASAVAKILMKNKYVVMLSMDEGLYIVSYVYSPYTDRNDVVFMSRDDYDTEMIQLADNIRNEYEDD